MPYLLTNHKTIRCRGTCKLEQAGDSDCLDHAVRAVRPAAGDITYRYSCCMSSLNVQQPECPCACCQLSCARLLHRSL